MHFVFSEDGCLSRVGNILVSEFQGDLLKISHDSEENDLSKLHGYLTNERGAVVLQILNIIGITVCFAAFRYFALSIVE